MHQLLWRRQTNRELRHPQTGLAIPRRSRYSSSPSSVDRCAPRRWHIDLLFFPLLAHSILCIRECTVYLYYIHVYTTNRRYKFASTPPPTDLLTSEAAADINQTGKVAATLELLATECTAGLSHTPYPSHTIVKPSHSLSHTLSLRLLTVLHLIITTVIIVMLLFRAGFYKLIYIYIYISMYLLVMSLERYSASTFLYPPPAIPCTLAQMGLSRIHYFTCGCYCYNIR